ncbi:hypothetical protein HOLleu_02788 [Holothuria leucospilota]|uniref:Ig-like domain-containing protein n=1 Tax=Holothuria leucospilota TaxID=206669 RepID=A0A9Q1CR63_HOLLE|nr:hypothetical protein HOLleu_02788 [Holothuria leucospilota]
MKCFTSVILLLFASCWTLSYAVNQLCRPLQYVEYRNKGTLICTFEGEFLSLFWYDYHDATTVNPVLIFDEYGKSGSGYESGEYDMYSNGSLIINEVSMNHDRNFTVVVRYSQTVKSSTIEVVVKVSPEQSYPVIGNCESGQNCFITMIYQEDIVCLVKEAKPATKLEWYSRSSRQDNIIPTTMTISKGVLGYVTKAIATYQLPQSYTLKLFMCKAHAIPSLLGSQQSQMLVEFNTNSFSPPETSDIFVKLFSNYTMQGRMQVLTKGGVLRYSYYLSGAPP